MLRGTRLFSIVAMVLAGALAMPAADAAPEVVRIADPSVRTFVTANTVDIYVRMQPAQTNTLQRWTLDRSSSTTGTKVVNVGTMGCLTISPTGSIAEGVLLAQLPCQGTTSELWRLVSDSTTRVRFVNVRTGWCMTVEPTTSVLPPRLRLYRCGTISAQQFVLLTG